MTREELVAEAKRLALLIKQGRVDEAYEGFSAVYANPAFGSFNADDQRQILRFMVLGKRPELHRSVLPASIVEAHRGALATLNELVSTLNDPADYELLGLAFQRIGNDAAAANIFREGLRMERERNPQSDLCGALMSRLSAV
jgi:tetratricopeptide (TPR) repeat protein